MTSHAEQCSQWSRVIGNGWVSVRSSSLFSTMSNGFIAISFRFGWVIQEHRFSMLKNAYVLHVITITIVIVTPWTEMMSLDYRVGGSRRIAPPFHTLW